VIFAIIEFSFIRYEKKKTIVASDCNPSNSGGLQFKTSPYKKLGRPPSPPISWVWWYTLVIPAVWEA
jgi:hypothetical protein